MRIGWANKGIFKALRGELKVLTDRDFERGTLPYLRLVYSGLVTPPARRDFDAAGADHLVWSDAPPFPLVAQCKGFKANEWEIGDRQIQQCLRSIRAFRESGFTAATYLLVHNRTNENPKFRETINAELNSLVRDGIAAQAELWDADTIVKRALTALYTRLSALARESNLSVVKEYAAAEPELCEPTRAVSIRSSVLTADQYKLTKTTEGAECIDDPAQLLLKSNTHFSLLLGYAGFGKTTTTLQLTKDPSVTTFFVPAARLDHLTTKDILEKSIDVEQLLSDVLPEDIPIARRAAKLVVEYFFKMDDGSYLLLLDGIDESLAVSQRGGLQQLFNALRGMGCRIVLTVRKEFFEQRLSDFASSVGLVTNREHRIHNQSIQAIELLPWSDEHIIELVQRFAQTVDNAEARERLEELIRTIASGEYTAFYGDIPRRPLFLRFILETVASSGVRVVRRSELFQEWARLKIARDVSRPAQQGGQRLPIGNEVSLDDTVDLAFAAMAWAAKCMTRIAGTGEVELLATCGAAAILEMPELRNSGTVDGLILNSLLVPAGPRIAPEPMEVRFAHRAYQEYFLSRYVRSNPKAFAQAALPDAILEWMKD